MNGKRCELCLFSGPNWLFDPLKEKSNGEIETKSLASRWFYGCCALCSWANMYSLRIESNAISMTTERIKKERIKSKWELNYWNKIQLNGQEMEKKRMEKLLIIIMKILW